VHEATVRPQHADLWGRHEARPVSKSTSLIVLLVGASLFSASAALVGSGALHEDRVIERTLNQVPSWADSLLTPLSRLFAPVGIALVALVSVGYCVIRIRSAWPIAFAGLAMVLAWLGDHGAKAVADRPRPYQSVSGAILRQAPAHGTSFPSSHTAVAVALCLAIIPYLPRPGAAIAVVYVALLAWSRVFLGVHFPLDVLGGAGIGLMAGAVTLLVSGYVDRRRVLPRVEHDR
jgi:membrane-associated phospholipid phosphatase